MRKRKISILLAGLLAFAAPMLEVSQMTVAAQEESVQEETAEDYEYTAQNSGTMSYQEEYVDKHLRFLDTPKYQAIRSYEGGMAAQVTLAYEEAHLNTVNRTWSMLSNTAKLIGGGELKLVNEYDLIVSEIMQNSAAREAFLETYEARVLSAEVEALERTSKLLKSGNDIVQGLTTGKAKKVEEVCNRIDQILITIQDISGTSKEEITTLYEDALETVNQYIDSNFLAEEKEKLMNTSMIFDMVNMGASVGANTYADTVKAYALYSASISACDEWTESWKSIAKHAAQSSSEKDQKLAESIEAILEQIEAAKEDMAMTLVQKAMQSGEKYLLQDGLKYASDAWNDALGKWSVGKAIRDGLIAGVKVSNVLLDSDDIAYYGQMLDNTGYLSVWAYQNLIHAELELRSEQSFESAVMFDEAFNIYKEVQLASCDYAISYYNTIATAPAGQVFYHTAGDEIAATVQFAVEKAEISDINCHKEETEVINNGGRVVAYQGNTYYWKYTEGSVETGGLLANFYVQSGAQCQLICRNSAGQETVLLTDTPTGTIYICGNHLFYEYGGGANWKMCSLTGEYQDSFEATRIDGVDTEHGFVLLHDYIDGYFVVAEDGSRTVLDISVDAVVLGLRGSTLYYGVADDIAMGVYEGSLYGGTGVLKGEIRLQVQENYGGLAVTDVLTREDGIYFSCGIYAGSGAFFSAGGIFRINYDGGVDALVNSANRPVTFPKFIVEETENGTNIYFSSGEDYSAVTYSDSWMNQNVYKLDLASGEIQPESTVTICNAGDAVLKDGSLWTRYEDSAELVQVLSAEQAAALGYYNLGQTEGETQVLVKNLDLVGVKIYFTITNITEDPAYSMGWRPGFSRDRMKLYETVFGSGECTLVNEY